MCKMDIERINENTVKFYISYIDIEKRGFSRDEIWFNRDKSEELFWEMMDEINDESDFEVEGPLWIQVHGKVSHYPQEIIAPIGRKGTSIIEREVREDGLFAHTDVDVIRHNSDFSHVKCLLHTGRTHQIRVHLAHIGHPIIGDDLYGGSVDRISRQALHCASVDIKHPLTGKRMTFTSPLPEDMKNLLN